MSLAPIIHALVAAGATPEVIAAAVEAVEAENARKEAERKAAQNARKARSRAKATAGEGDVTECHVTSRDVTPCHSDSSSLPSEVSPRPPSYPSILTPVPPIVPQKSGRKAADEAFEAAWTAYPHVRGRSSKTKSLAEWRKLDETTRQALPAAIARFRAESKDAKGECGAAAMERWLRDAKFLDWMVGPALLDVPCEPWPGPSEFRADVVAQHGEEFARSYLDPSGWKNGSDRHVLARTGMAADRMARELRPILAKHGITVKHERAVH
jgi:hypothetical protein